MPAKWINRIIGAAALAAIAGGLAWFAWPRPILVDLATVARGPIEVTADDDGKTRVRHVYTVSAPIAGKVLRISHPLGKHGPSLHVGDEVVAGQTVVAVMQPTLPGFIDVRSRDQLQAKVLAADAAIQQQEAEVQRIDAALDFARTEFQRAQTLISVPVSLGHRNHRMTEVLSGLVAGDRVVLHPSDRVGDESRIAQRKGY
jgi:HlyD family secretion protein